MIPLWINVVAFYALAFITKSRTFSILALSSLANLAIDHFTSADSQWLMLIYSSIEFFTAIVILKYGDIQQIYQSIMLFCMLILHFVGQIQIIYDNYAYFESGLYSFTMSMLIIFQLLGADGGTYNINTIFRPNSNWHKNYHPYLSNRK